MKPEIKSQWVADLRSGLYEQTCGTLRAIDYDGWCCLGVLCDIYSRETGIKWTEHSNGTVTIHGEGGALPTEVVMWAGLESADPSIETIEFRALSVLNDSGKYDFEAIANIIEAQL